MSAPHRGTIAATLAAAFLTILAALVAVPSTASAQGTGDPMFEAPTIGECKNYTREQGAASTETSAPVDCTTTHTAKVYDVVLLPSTLDWDSNESDLVRTSAKKCYPAWTETLGRTDKLRQMSAYSFYFFWPTQAQQEAGARWIRCDMTLYGGTKLMPLPVDTLPMLPPAPLPDNVAACRAGDNLLLTTCDRSHRLRATGGVTLADGPYPGRKKFIKVATNRCPDLVTNNRGWHAFWPSRFFWKLGDRTLVCYTRTSN
jgi:hypothetical protein